MKCEHCGSDMIWQGSMLDGGLACSSCVASDTMPVVDDTVLVIDDPFDKVLNFGGNYIDFDTMTPDEWKNALKNLKTIGIYRFARYHYRIKIGNRSKDAILSPDAGSDYWAYVNTTNGCSCHTGHAPCSDCTHPGNPHNLENRDDCVFF